MIMGGGAFVLAVGERWRDGEGEGGGAGTPPIAV